jgi:putative protease
MAAPVVDIEVVADAATVRVAVVGLDAEWESHWKAEPARKRSLSADTLRQEFARSADSGLAAGNVTVSIADGLFVPASALKALRRDFWNWAAGEIDRERIRQRWSTPTEALPTPEHRATESTVLAHDDAPCPGEQDVVARRLATCSAGDGADEAALPDFCSEEDLPALRAAVKDALAQGIRRLRITSLYGFDLLPPDSDLTISTSFPLPACNRWAVAELRALGADKVQAWVELDGQSMRDLAQEFGGAIEIYSYGRVPILFTRFAIPAEGHITDGRGAGFETVGENGETILLPEKVLQLPPIPGASSFVDLTHATPGEQDTTDFNFSRDFV